MLSREYIEGLPNWQATYESVRTGRIMCLMRTIKGGFYWDEPGYDGMFPAGATSAFQAWMLTNIRFIKGEAINA